MFPQESSFIATGRELKRKIQEIINEIVSQSGVDAVVLITSDGLPMFSRLYDEQDETTIAAAGASIIHVGESTVKDMLRKGQMKRVIFEAEEGKVILQRVRDGISILVSISAKSKDKLGWTLYLLDKACEKLSGLFGEERFGTVFPKGEEYNVA
ncbi:MAG: hypothetical protein B6U95_00390 [Thermofilum sp. ex4484_82]|nr:MAG: hypothetical protein B6U95_00390 [Thermofilum sp. ex4484_82]OYT40074.1 MAG: hypothetical protein B6U96_00395 [Archaeoglobales archaeon ex4484_92]